MSKICGNYFYSEGVIDLKTVTILPETTTNPITLIGKRAGVCWGADITNDKKNYQRGMECIKANHGRVLEFVNIEAVIDGFSARVIREWYTHIGGSPTRLQASTRYIDYKDFGYITPESISKDKEVEEVYKATMEVISTTARLLEGHNIPREDIGMILPLGMTTKIVDRRNVRNVIDMSRQRMCSRAYWEYRELFKMYTNKLAEYSDEWKTLIEITMKPKCEVLGYCPETRSCGKYKKEVSE